METFFPLHSVNSQHHRLSYKNGGECGLWERLEGRLMCFCECYHFKNCRISTKNTIVLPISYFIVQKWNIQPIWVEKMFKFEWTMNPSNPPEYKIQTHPFMIFYLKYIGRWLTKTCKRQYEQKKLIIMLHLCCALMLDTPVLYCHRRLSKLNIDCHVCLPNLQINSSEHNSHS